MKTKGIKKDKVGIVTLGCSKNTVDSEVMLTQLKGSQIAVSHESGNDDANIIIINTCGFIDHAKQESIDTIVRYAEAKKEGIVDKVYVTGCLSQRYKDELVREIPEVDAWFGTAQLPALLKAFHADYKHELIGQRITTTPNHYAYLKISEGCDRPCAFCAIPLMRGRHVSKPMEHIIDEAENMVRNGVKEILVIAQDSTYYGLDLYKKRCLAELLRRLSDVEGLEWIRLHYAFPTGFPEDVLEVMAERSNICNYLDIPLQHASDSMLKLMRRGTTREKTEDLLKKIRDKVPGIGIRTTLIAGHAGETQADFEEMLDFVEQNRFERLGVFTYSHEEDTHAYRQLQDDVPEETKEERADAIMDLQASVSAQLNARKIGQQLNVLVDRKEGNHFIGRTEFDSPEVDNEVLMPAENYLRVGDFTQAKITASSAFDLEAEPVIKP